MAYKYVREPLTAERGWGQTACRVISHKKIPKPGLTPREYEAARNPAVEN